MTAKVIDDSHGSGYSLFLAMKTEPSKIVKVGAENKSVRHFGLERHLWTQIEPLPDEIDM